MVERPLEIDEDKCVHKTHGFKVGDKVQFIEYEDESEWEKTFGLKIGDVSTITNVRVHVWFNGVCVSPDQIKKVN